MIEIKLKEILEERNLTISELSRDTGIARSTLTPIVNTPEEVKSIRFSTLDTLCEYLNCHLKDIIDYQPNKEKFDIVKIYSLDFQSEGLLMVQANKETSFSKIPVFLSVYGSPIPYIKDEEIYDSEALKITIEVMDRNELLTVESNLSQFDIDEDQLSKMDKYATEIRSWLNNADRNLLRSLTIDIFSKLIKMGMYEQKSDVRITWSVGSQHFDSLKNSFEFEVDYTNRTIKDISNYNSLHNNPVTNFNFL